MALRRVKNACARDWGCIKTDPKFSTPSRLALIHEEVSSIFSNWSPGLIVIEDIFVKEKMALTALNLGKVMGVVCLAAYNLKMEIMEIRPTEVKYALTGSGRAGKEQIQKTVMNFLKIEKKITPSHASDALALALTGLSRKGLIR